MVCEYCDNSATEKLQIAPAKYQVIRGEKRLVLAAQYIDVCQKHKQHFESTMLRDSRGDLTYTKRSVRRKAMRGQITVEDYL